MSEIEKKLRNYIDDIKQDKNYDSVWEEWAFGAIDFAKTAGMISNREYRSIMIYYDILKLKEGCHEKND